MVSTGVKDHEQLTYRVSSLTSLADAGDAQAQADLAQIYCRTDLNIRDGAKAFHYAKLSADQGNADGQYALGYCYFDGFGVERDESLAAHWYGAAARQGLASAQSMFGSFCSEGAGGVPVNDEEAFQWWSRSAAQGHPWGLYNFGYALLHGQGSLQDIKRGREAMKQAAALGNSMACEWLVKHPDGTARPWLAESLYANLPSSQKEG